MDPKALEILGDDPPVPEIKFGRRGYLGLGLAAATVGGTGWLSKWVGSPAARADRSFRHRLTWRETLPTEAWDAANLLPLHHDPFETESSLVSRSGRQLIDGASHDVASGNGQLVVRNEGRGRSTEAYTTPLTIAAPWVSIAATVSDRSDDARIAIGLSKEDGGVISGGIGREGASLGYRIDGNRFEAPGTGTTLSGPFDLLTILMGDRLSLLTREPGHDWAYRGHIGWRNDHRGINLYDRAEWEQWNPTVLIETESGGAVAIEDFRVIHTLQFGIRDPTVVTYPDGTPLVRDDELYLTVTCGSVDHRGYQAVLGLDVETYDVSMHAALWAESVPGHISNYVASHLMYDPDHDEFRQSWSGFGNGPHEPYWNQKCWVSRTRADLLSGTHVVPCERMHLPSGVTGRQHDPFIVRDEEAGTWRCVHNSDAIHRVTLSETTDDRWTDGWTPVAHYRDIAHQIEGGKLARIDGKLVLSYADEGSRNHMVTAAYPDPSAGRRWIDVDVPPGDVAPHPSIVGVPSGDGTTLLLITMDGETIYGLGEPSHGALVIYEADGGLGR